MKFWVLFDGFEEGEAILYNKVHARDEGLEALGTAMALKVKSKASETHLGKEDRGGLEGPGDVVAVAVDHEDEATWRGEGEP